MEKDLTKEIKEEAKKQVIEKHTPTEDDVKNAKDMFEAASAPVEFNDEDFKLAPQELDIRNLNEKNYKQVMFRLQSMNVTLQRQNAQLLVDIERLLMLLLDRHGLKADRIPDSIDKLIESLTKNQTNKA